MRRRAPVPVLYPSFLSCYGAELGWVAAHPQFKHLANPPAGYYFTEKAAPDPSRNVVRVATGLVDLNLRLEAAGVPEEIAREFVKSRRPELQPYIPAHTRLEFLPTYPFTLGQVPWMIEIEDTTTLLFPFLANDRSAEAAVVGTPWHTAVRVLLQHPGCRGIVTHVRSTADSLPILFQDPDLAAKVTHAPVGMQLPDRSNADRTRDAEEPVTLLFSNSWHQDPRSFYLRGGLDVLEAFMILRQRRSNVRLVIRSELPADLDPRYVAAARLPEVEVLDQKLSDVEMEALLASADIYVLPSARLHVVSVLQALARGMATVVSDGWGMREYVEDGVTGVVVRGRAGTTSWTDSQGVLRENYTPTFSSTPALVQELTGALERLIDDAQWRRQLGTAARERVRREFTIERWNDALGSAFDKALAC